MDIGSLYLSESETTFQFDENLPDLPIPSLDETLQRYLESVRPHISEDELKATREIVVNFETGEGPKLQKLLLERSRNHRNWLENWWLDVAYLSQRLPLIPYSNTCGLFPLKDPLWAPDSIPQIPRAALITYFTLQYYKLLRSEKLKPEKPRGTPWSMSQFRRCFNTIRIPRQQSDQLSCSFVTEREGPSASVYLIVLCKGHIYKMIVLDSDEEPLTPPELEQQFGHIFNESKRHPRGPNIASLTYDDRSSWAKNRERLISLHVDNSTNLKEIENAMMFLSFDEAEPSTDDEVRSQTKLSNIYGQMCVRNALPACIIFHLSLGGEVGGRWADSSTAIIFKNGTVAYNADHTPFDGMVGMSMNYFIYLNTEKCQGKWKESDRRDFLNPTRLDFVLDSTLCETIETITEKSSTSIDSIACDVLHFSGYGKTFITSKKINPDTFVQLALQLAYYRLHEKPAPTYETASTRAFYNGRTETVRSCTIEAIEFAESMIDPSANDNRIEKLRSAVKKHDLLMKMAKANEGCDRHLLGLYLISVESGSDIPQIYKDSAFVKSGGNGNFILSTSLLGYTAMSGAAAAMCSDGYGVFYCILSTGIRFNITAWKHSAVTDVHLLSANIEKSLFEMQTLIGNSNL